jgi:hypothetical protein
VISDETDEEKTARIAAICEHMTKMFPQRIAAIQNQRAMANLCSVMGAVTLNP